MADKELEIQITATGADKAAAEVRKVEAAVAQARQPAPAPASAGPTPQAGKKRDEIEQALAVELLLTDAVKAEAAGHHAAAEQLRNQAAEMALALSLQKRFALAESAAVALARERLTAERQIEVARRAELAAAQAQSRADREAADAAKKKEAAARAAAAAENARASFGQRLASFIGGGSTTTARVAETAGMSSGLAMAAGAGAILGTALIKVSRSYIEANEEQRKFTAEVERAQQVFTTGFNLGGIAEMASLTASAAANIRSLDVQIDALSHKELTWNDLAWAKLTGADTAHERAAKMAEQREQEGRNIGAALKKEAELGRETVRIAELRAAGKTREADAAERQRRLEDEIRKITSDALLGTGTAASENELIAQARARAAAAQSAEDRQAAAADAAATVSLEQQAGAAELRANHEDRAAAAMERANALGRELQKINSTENQADAAEKAKQSEAAIAAFRANDAAIREKNAASDAASTVALQQQAAAAELRANRQDRAADAMERANALGRELQKINGPESDAPEEERTKQTAAAIAAFRANELQIANRLAQQDSDRLEIARDGIEVQKQKLSGDSTDAKLKQIEKELDHEILRIRRQIPDEQARVLIGLKEEEAALKRQVVIQEAQERTEKALAQARGRVAVLEAQNAGHQAEAELLKINLGLEEKLREIRKGPEDEETKKRLELLEKEAAALERVELLRKNMRMTTREKAAQRQEDIENRQADRILEQRAVNKARSERANDARRRPSERRLTPDEEQAVRENFRKGHAGQSEKPSPAGPVPEPKPEIPPRAAPAPAGPNEYDPSFVRSMPKPGADVTSVPAVEESGGNVGEKIAAAIERAHNDFLGRIEGSLSALDGIGSAAEGMGSKLEARIAAVEARISAAVSDSY